MRRLVPHLPGRTKRWQSAPRRPRYVVDIELDDGAQLVERLRQQGLAPDEVIFKYFWPRYAPPSESGIQSLLKSENLAWQFERLVAMHRIVPSAIPLPVGLVRNASGELIGYVLERIEGVALQELVEVGAFVEVRRRLAAVERTVAKLHARSISHGDLNAYNVIASDDGRTILIDPVASPGPGTMLQDELSLRELRELIPGS
ncbi:MAG TPA: RIO1 family regulatory kinase/ATPase [Gaiellaceae bacterium]|nr:RIO1 family regulatory kinase/ATPase [Gaiellaceae bacterium]